MIYCEAVCGNKDTVKLGCKGELGYNLGFDWASGVLITRV